MRSHLRIITTLACGFALLVAQTPNTSFARGGGGHGGGGHGGGGHGGGGHFGGGGHMGGGHFGGGGGHMGGFSGGHMGGGFRGGAPMGGFNGGRMGGHVGSPGRVGGFNGGPVGGFNGGRVGGFNGNIGTPHIGGQGIRQGQNFGGQFRGGNQLGGAGVRGFQGGQGMVHHGVNMQPGHNFQGGRGFQQQAITPNHNLYRPGGGQGMAGRPGGQMLSHNHGLGGAAGLGQRPGGAGPLMHGAGRPNLNGNGGFGNHAFGGRGNHVIGGPGHGIHTVSHNGGNFGGGHNLAQFHGGRGNFAHQGNWGINQGGWNNRGGWNRGGWNGGINRGNWGGAYRNVVINNNYYGWYGGPWGGMWGWGWGYPFWGRSLFWGLGGFFSPWWGWGGGWGGYGGYGGYASYYNPYCVYGSQYGYVSPLGTDYYTQPVAIAEATQTQDPKMAAAFQLVEDGRALFLKGDYQGALAKYDTAIPDLKGDPVVHELRALALFALGDYHEAAATLNALLAVAPGMDWASMRNQYPDVTTYTTQLRKLEAFLRENPDDAAARFVLGYHYLVTNFPDVALKQFQRVVELEPRDAVAKKMVETLSKGKSTTTPAPTNDNQANAPVETDLVGSWLAKTDDGTQFALVLNDAGDFIWTVTPQKGNPVKQTGKYTITPDRLILDAAGQNDTLMARVESRGPDHFRFWVTDDGSLAFRREGVNTPEPPQAASKSSAAALPSAPIPPRAGIPAEPAADQLPVITLPSPTPINPADATVPSNKSTP